MTLLHPGQHNETADVLEPRVDPEGSIADALDEIVFPVPWNQSVLDVWRARMDALHVRNLAAAFPQASNQLLARLTAGVPGRSRCRSFRGTQMFPNLDVQRAATTLRTEHCVVQALQLRVV